MTTHPSTGGSCEHVVHENNQKQRVPPALWGRQSRIKHMGEATKPSMGEDIFGNTCAFHRDRSHSMGEDCFGATARWAVPTAVQQAAVVDSEAGHRFSRARGSSNQSKLHPARRRSRHSGVASGCSVSFSFAE